MTRDAQLQGVSLDSVMEKRRLDQALNAKEFAVAAGISYSTAREWFRSPGFPALRGVVFWTDFVTWRHEETGITTSLKATEVRVPELPMVKPSPNGLPAKAARILAEVV